MRIFSLFFVYYAKVAKYEVQHLIEQLKQTRIISS
ncbi:hypothetical protein M493_17260 [Geobacillus genomosp. 3]|uniref:Uncharacterized protein n=1 Tax=Geobacillus genomosp. 3 TaxID=1921421 RepID=S5ZH93_GEOG3|nr:hypothetical protein M493_17260 [Geobacillus genomosp. 3]AKM20528.1 hypothetical protein GARCT_03303 [Geobacillus sp. 12AMOR1]